MADDITSLLDALATPIDPTHRDAVWQRVLTERAQSAFGGDGNEPSDDQRGEVELLTVPPRVIRLGSRRSVKFVGLVAAVVVLIAGIAAVAHRGPSDIKINTGPTSDASVTSDTSSTVETVPPTTTPPSASIPSAVPSPQGPATTFDALQLGPVPKGTVIATLDGVVVGNISSSANGLLKLTPEGDVYYVAEDPRNDVAFVQTFTASGLGERFALPDALRIKTSQGEFRVGGWFLGPQRVLYGVRVDDIDSTLSVGVVAVPMSGPKAGSIIADVATQGTTGCNPTATGVTCGGSGTGATEVEVLRWVDPQGSPTGSAVDGPWLAAGSPHSGTSVDRVETVGLDGLPFAIINLQGWMAQVKAAAPSSGLPTVWAVYRRDEACIVGQVGSGNPGFAACADATGKVIGSMLPVTLGLTPDGNFIGPPPLAVPSGFYSLERAGDRFNLVRYDFGFIFGASDGANVVPAATTSVPSKQSSIVFDALTLGSSQGSVLATFDGAVVGDFESGLGRTPEGGTYYAGYTSNARDHYFVQFFADGALPASRYELPTEYLAKSTSGGNLYGSWMVGPGRVLYGMQFKELGLALVAIVAVPTNGPKDGTVVARADAGGHIGCWPTSAGIQCDIVGMVQPWVDPSGAATGRTFPDATWLVSPAAASAKLVLLEDMFTENKPIPVKLPDGRTISVTNLLPWIELPAAVISFRELSTSQGRTCVLGAVGGEGGSQSFELCIDDAGKVTSTTLGTAAHSLMGGSLQMTTDKAMYTIEPSGDRFDLIRYDF
jgi:hypothetical protein